MMDVADQVIGLTRAGFWAGFWVFIRIGAMVAVLPGFGERSLPARVKLGAALAFTVVVAPAVGAELPDTQAGLQHVVPEAAIGLMIGMMLRLFIHALQIAGTIIAQATSLSQIFGAGNSEPQPAVGFLLTMAGLALAMNMGLHVAAAELMIGSYQAFPVGQMVAPDLVREWGTSGVAHAFQLAFSISAPFVVGSLVYNAALGAINRAMPQLMVSFVGAPALTLGGLMLMAVAVPTGLIVWRTALGAALIDPLSVIP